MRKTGVFIVLVGLMVSLQFCRKEEVTIYDEDIDHGRRLVLPDEVYDYAPYIPDFISNTLVQNQTVNGFYQPFELSNELATLGRVLFYDTRLSVDNTISCGSCHQQENAFSSSVQFSEGIDGQLSSRNSMSLANMRWARRFFWDIRENNLADQVLQPIVHPEEMGADLPALVEKLSQIEEYKPLFLAAFETDEVSEGKIADALAHFIRGMVSFDSKYDEGRVIEFANFTAAEEAGRLLFLSGDAKCNHCHNGETFFQANDPRNNGLPDPLDQGVFEISGNESDRGKFKTMTLRNVGVTGPYMHDGRFETLEEVIEFYNSGIQPHPNLDDRLTEEISTGGTPVQMNLTEEQKSNLAAFLRTLTGQSLLSDERFADPFVD